MPRQQKHARRRPPEPARYAGAGAGEELFGALSNREIAARGLTTFAFSLGTLILGLGAVAFALLYALDVGLRMVLIGTVSFVRFQRSKGEARASDAFWGALFLTFLWLLLVVLPVLGVWTGAAGIPAGAALRALDLRVGLLALLLLGLAVRQARHEARQPEQPGPTLYQPVLSRALRIAAFVFFGPFVFTFLRAAGSSEPVAIALTWALAEAYPFVATLIDRGLHVLGRKREPGSRRRGQPQVRQPRTP